MPRFAASVMLCASLIAASTSSSVYVSSPASIFMGVLFGSLPRMLTITSRSPASRWPAGSVSSRRAESTTTR